MNEYNKTEIRRLLDLYYEGQSSACGETTLRDYFSRPDTDPEFDDDKSFFNALAGNDDSIEVPSHLEQRLSHAVDSWQEAEQQATAARHRFRIFSLRPAISIAASVAILFAIGSMFLNNPWKTGEPADTFTDPMEAYAETQRVLTLFANTLDKSMDGIDTAERSREKALALAMEQLKKI